MNVPHARSGQNAVSRAGCEVRHFSLLPGDVDVAGPLSTKGSAGHMQCSTCLSCAALLKNLFPKPIVSGLHDSTLPAMVPILQQTLEIS